MARRRNGSDARCRLRIARPLLDDTLAGCPFRSARSLDCLAVRAWHPRVRKGRVTMETRDPLRVASWRFNSGIAIFAIALSGCSDFGDLQRGVCGNGIIEPGEDCDSSDGSCVRCAVTCRAAADCPSADYACGVDGFCHAPGGALAAPTAPVTFAADELRITDVDHDGIGDVLGLTNTSLVVRHGDAAGALTTFDSFVTPAQSGPAGFGDLDGDGTIDLALSTRDGLVTYASPFGDPSPVDVATPITAQDGTVLDIAMMFPVGPLQLGVFFRVPGEVALAVVDFTRPNQPYVVQ